MEIADDGVGGIKSRGHGLSNIQDRVYGWTERSPLSARLGGGTRLEVRIPCG